MALDWTQERGVPLEAQQFDWFDLVRHPQSKLDTDAFARMRTLLITAIEGESSRFLDACARNNPDLRLAIGRVRRVERAQQTLTKLLLPANVTPIERAIIDAQLAIEVGAVLAQREPQPARATVYRYGVADDVDHLYRLAALYDRLEGKDANSLLQSYTDIRPGRPTSTQPRVAQDNLGLPDPAPAMTPESSLYAMTSLALAEATDETFLAYGPLLADPVARALFVELGILAAQGVERKISLFEEPLGWIGQWLLHEAAEVYHYAGCVDAETDPGMRAVWTRFLEYELGHLHAVAELARLAGLDPLAFVPATLPDFLPWTAQRAWIQDVVGRERDLRAIGPAFAPVAEEAAGAPVSLASRVRLHQAGIPSEAVAAGYRWEPGTELATHPAPTIDFVLEERHGQAQQ
jgi:hypothetical protein